jgi:hypothetical protein
MKQESPRRHAWICKSNISISIKIQILSTSHVSLSYCHPASCPCMYINLSNKTSSHFVILFTSYMDTLISGTFSVLKPGPGESLLLQYGRGKRQLYKLHKRFKKTHVFKVNRHTYILNFLQLIILFHH